MRYLTHVQKGRHDMWWFHLQINNFKGLEFEVVRKKMAKYGKLKAGKVIMIHNLILEILWVTAEKPVTKPMVSG